MAAHKEMGYMKLFNVIRADIHRRRWYFSAAAEEIAEKNMNMLRSLSTITVALLIFLLFLAPLVINNWTISVWHEAFVPVSIAFCIIVRGVMLTGKRNKNLAIIMCSAFWIMILTFSLLIDVFSNPSAPSCFMPIICVVLPASFIFPMHLSYGIVFLFGFAYMMGLVMFKSNYVGQYDMFRIICAFGISAVVYYYIMLMRVRDYENCVKYEKLSMRDTLITGLYNKQSAQLLINRYAELNNPIEACAFLVLDVDNFKQINDTYGHHTGDQALRYVGEVLMDVFDENDIIARFGGDEFIVFIAEKADKQTIHKNCLKISDKLKKVSETEIGAQIECSIGAVVAENCNVDGFDGMFCRADAAMYYAKNYNKGNCVIRNYGEQN